MLSGETLRECDASMEDTAIVRAYREHKHATCFRLLYDRYAGMVYSKAVTMLHEADEAEDATQEIFTKVFLNLGKFEGQSKFSTWLYSIAYNLCVDRIRKRKRDRTLLTDVADSPDVAEVPDETLMEMQLSELRYILGQLTPDERTLLLLKYKDGVRISAIAHLLNASESAIKMRLKRTKAKAQRIHAQKFAAAGIR